MTSSVVYYSVEAQTNEIYVFFTQKNLNKPGKKSGSSKYIILFDDVICACVTQLTTNENSEWTLIIVLKLIIKLFIFSSKIVNLNSTRL